MRYTQEQISAVLILLKATGSPDTVIQALGYPSGPMLYHWRDRYPEYFGDVPSHKHWKQAPTDLKQLVIKRCLINGERVESVAEEIGYSKSIIYKWMKEHRQKGHVLSMKKAIALLKPDEKPILHSDRGCHYRWPEWIKLMDSAGLTRSMSKKGCSPDNSACEGFFGHLKTEMFYNHDWDQCTIDDFINEIDDYMHWYRQERIKLTLGGLSPLDYRRSIGVSV